MQLPLRTGLVWFGAECKTITW